jgi:hypothetical protein
MTHRGPRLVQLKYQLSSRLGAWSLRGIVSAFVGVIAIINCSEKHALYQEMHEWYK